MDENSSPNVSSTTGDQAEHSFKAESLLDRVKSKIPDASSFAKNILIPAGVVVTVLLVGVGGTYVIASNVLNKSTDSPQTSRISEEDLAQSDVLLPSSTPIPPTPTFTPAPTASPSPTPIVNPAAGWTSYTFSALNLDFSYPPGWFVNVPSTSGAPYLYVQNFSGSVPIGYNPGQFAILVARLEQVGITTIPELSTQLALNAASNVTINGVNMGQVSVLSSAPTTINGYQALVRNVTYSSFPSAQMTETYVLDGVSNVVQFVPLLDTQPFMTFYNTLLSTIEFTN